MCLLSLDLMSRRALFIAVLQRRQAITVERHVGINRIRVQALAHHEHGLAMLVSACAQERDVGCQTGVALNFLPGEMEGVGRGPNVLATAADCVCSLGRVVFQCARVESPAHDRMTLKTGSRRRARPEVRTAKTSE